MKKVPDRLSKLLIAVGKHLTGEQVAALAAEAERVYDTTLNSHESRIANWLLSDEEVAEYYGHERSEGLEAIREAQNKASSALRHVTEGKWRSDYDIAAELCRIKSASEDAIKRWQQCLVELREAGITKPQ